MKKRLLKVIVAINIIPIICIALMLYLPLYILFDYNTLRLADRFLSKHLDSHQQS